MITATAESRDLRFVSGCQLGQKMELQAVIESSATAASLDYVKFRDPGAHWTHWTKAQHKQQAGGRAKLVSLEAALAAAWITTVKFYVIVDSAQATDSPS